MLTFLFWNVNRKPLQEIIANLANQHRVDVILLAEWDSGPAPLLQALNRQTSEFHYPGDQCEKVQILTRLPERFFVRTSGGSNRLTFRHIRLPARVELLLAGIHFPDKTSMSDFSQGAECEELANAIQQAEREVGHTRTILVGDLNMNPFEQGVVKANGLHAVMSRRVAQREARTVQRRSYPFFYNPMWCLFGDWMDRAPGTHYYLRGEHVVYFWNLFDQVLVRPALLSYFRNEELRILTGDGTTPFLTDAGLPDSSAVSDHLPLLFRLDV
jgi:hypothetical protein